MVGVCVVRVGKANSNSSPKDSGVAMGVIMLLVSVTVLSKCLEMVGDGFRAPVDPSLGLRSRYISQLVEVE